MTDDLPTRSDAFKRWVLSHRDAAQTERDPILRAQAVKLIDDHLATLEDLTEAAQLDKPRGVG